jgi:hypothetical protein
MEGDVHPGCARRRAGGRFLIGAAAAAGLPVQACVRAPASAGAWPRVAPAPRALGGRR